MVAILSTPLAEVSAREGMALDEFLRRQDKHPFEIIEGHVIEMSPTVYGSTYIVTIITEALYVYKASGYPIVIHSDATFVLPNVQDAAWVKGSRIPDVMVYDFERLRAYRANTVDWRLKPLALVPDLAVEVVSPTDRLPDVWRKAATYLEDGVPLVWIINPMQEVVTIFAADEAPITLDKSGTLDGGQPLPGFMLALETLFAV